MKTLADIKKEFIREASEYDTGRSEEDFHTYLRHHNLEHHLSETQIQDRNRESNGLNGGSLVLGVAVPLTLGAIFGFQKLTSDIIGHGGHDQFNYDEARQMMGIREPRYNARMLGEGESLSGINTRPMPTADPHIGQSIPTLTIPITGGVPSVNIDFSRTPPMPEFPDVPSTRFYDQARSGFMERKVNLPSRAGLFPPQEESLL
jgi:hypothetical protein